MARGPGCQLVPPLTLVIPAYNEAQRLGNTLRAVAEFSSVNGMLASVIVVDDGSTDGTSDVAMEHSSSDSPVDVVALPQQRGKGAAVRAGVLAADADVIGFMDADLSTPLDELPRVLAPLDDGYDLAIGSRGLSQSHVLRSQPAYRRAGASVFRYLAPGIAGLHGFPDSQCGFKFYRRDVARDLYGSAVIDRWMFDAEILRLAVHRGYRIAQVPVAWRDHPDSRLRLTLDTYRMFRDLMRIRVRFALKRYGASGRAA